MDMKPVDKATVERIKIKFSTEVIPKIIAAVERRQRASAESRGKYLNTKE